MTDTKHCRGCYFWGGKRSPVTPEEWPEEFRLMARQQNNGPCRRRSPNVKRTYELYDTHMDWVTNTFWPETHAEDWCGDWLAALVETPDAR